MVTLYTTAPQAYDYGYVERDTEPVGFMVLFKGEAPIFRVRMPQERVGYQTGRYASGLYPTLDDADLTEQAGVGLVRLAD